MYKGYFIPKGAMIVPVVWYVNISGVAYSISIDLITLRQMAHDPENYNDPFTFKPERFLEVEGRMPELDSRNFVFGFGRR